MEVYSQWLTFITKPENLQKKYIYIFYKKISLCYVSLNLPFKIIFKNWIIKEKWLIHTYKLSPDIR